MIREKQIKIIFSRTKLSFFRLSNLYRKDKSNFPIFFSFSFIITNSCRVQFRYRTLFRYFIHFYNSYDITQVSLYRSCQIYCISKYIYCNYVTKKTQKRLKIPFFLPALNRRRYYRETISYIKMVLVWFSVCWKKDLFAKNKTGYVVCALCVRR